MAPYKSDGGGIATKDLNIIVNDIKLFHCGANWKTRLALWTRPKDSCVYIETYSLPDHKYIVELLDKSTQPIKLIAHDKFRNKAIRIAQQFPNVEIRTHSETHSKIALVSPTTVIFSSANFGYSGWHENSIGIHSKDIFALKLQDFMQHWENCQPLE